MEFKNPTPHGRNYQKINKNKRKNERKKEGRKVVEWG